MGILNSGNMLGRIGSLLTGAAAGFEARMEMDRQQARADAIDARNWGRQLDLLGRQQGFQGEQARLGREQSFELQKSQQQFTSLENELARNAQQEATAAQQAWQSTFEADRATEKAKEKAADGAVIRSREAVAKAEQAAAIQKKVSNYESQIENWNRILQKDPRKQREYDQAVGQLNALIAGTTAESKVEYVSPASVAMAQTSLTSEEARDFKVHPALRNYAYLDANGEIKYRPALLSREESVQLIPGLKPYSYVAIDKNGEPKPFMHEDIKIKTEIYKADLIDYKDRRKAHESRIAEWEKGYALLLTQADKTKPETMEKLSQFEKSKPAPFDEQPPRDPLDENTDDLYRKNAAGSVKKYRINVNGVVKEYQMDKIEAAARNANMTIDQFMAEFGVK